MSPAETSYVRIHPLPVRVTHWINALAILVMVPSGWRIYNASPLFDFRFPDRLTLGGWLAGALQWHFAAMWLLALNGLVYRRLRHRCPATSGASCCRCRRRAVLRDVLRRPARPACARRPVGVQRGAARGLSRADRCCAVRAGAVRPRDLEAGAAARAGRADGRLRGRALRAFLRHGGCSCCSSSVHVVMVVAGAAHLPDDDHRTR